MTTTTVPQTTSNTQATDEERRFAVEVHAKDGWVAVMCWKPSLGRAQREQRRFLCQHWVESVEIREVQS